MACVLLVGSYDLRNSFERELERGRSVSNVLTSSAPQSAASRGGRLPHVTQLLSTTPRRMAAVLAVSILAAVLMSLIVYATYASIHATVTVARHALVGTDSTHLNQQYAAYQETIGQHMTLVWIAFLLVLGVLVGAQVYLFRHTHRILNLGYAIATLLTLGCMIVTLSAFNVGKSQLAMAEQKSFASITTWRSVRATAYLMNADERRYLLDAQNPQALAAVEGDFTDNQQQIAGLDPQGALDDAQQGVPFGVAGSLGDQLVRSTYPGERAAVSEVIRTFANYIAIDQQVRRSLAAGNVQQAQALVLGSTPGQAALAFTQFDSAMWNAIDINQFQFDQQIDTASSGLGPLPYVLGIALIAIVVATIVGMKPRLDEYAV
jgi:hypothetical protein